MKTCILTTTRSCRVGDEGRTTNSNY